MQHKAEVDHIWGSLVHLEDLALILYNREHSIAEES